MAIFAPGSTLVNNDGPASSTSSIAESILKPVEGGGSSKCFEACGVDWFCCVVM
jgi:hypothetical protein